jgi:DNA-binding response OmpR family regulator
MEYELLRVFLANPNRVLSRDQLLMHARNREWEPFDRSIDIRIGRLRRKIEPEPSGEPRCIRTVRKRRLHVRAAGLNQRRRSAGPQQPVD